ncbi:MAG: helix-turn-helix transcriptional regulator, partial [Sciscionella sp.]
MAAFSASSADGRTRQLVARLLLERGPVTAASVASDLGVSPAAVRRHLDALMLDGQVCSRQAPALGHRGRGRPAKQYLLTESGRSRFGHAYDDLAVSALRFLAESGGEQAVRAFAERRVAGMLGGSSGPELPGHDPQQRTEALADVLSGQGYAASAEHMDSGAQLC